MMERKLTRDLNQIEDDVIRAKRIINERLMNDPDIITALHNETIGYDDDRRSEYLDTNIFSYIRLPGTQDKVKNFICFKVDDIEDLRFNEVMKLQYVEFVVMSHADDIDTPWGMKRHDLLGCIIRQIFNWSNLLGLQMKCIYNQESVMDTSYSCRTLKFEITKPNQLYKGTANNKYEHSRIIQDHVKSTEDLLG